MNDRPAAPGDDGDLAEAARRITTILSRHADRIEPRHGAYARLAARVTVARPGPPSGLPSWLPTSRLTLSLSLVVVVALGGVVLVSGGRNEGGVGSADRVAGEALLARTSSGPATTTVAAGSSEAVDAVGEESEGTDEVIANPGREVALDGGIARADKAEASIAFLQHLGLDHQVTVELVGDDAIVHVRNEDGSDGPPIAVLELVPAPGDHADRWVVLGATSSEMVIEEPLAQAMIVGDTVVVSGRGIGHEGVVEVKILAATDGRPLAVGQAQAGGTDGPAPFSVTLPLVGAENLWVVVRPTSGSEDIESAFAVIPISSIGAHDPTTYRVVHVEEDDPGEGPSLKAEASSGSARLAVLEGGAALSRRVDDVPTRDGSTVWWPVSTDDGLSGWAASQHLAAGDPVTSESLTTEAADFLRAASYPPAAPGLVAGADRLGVTVVSEGTRARIEAATLADPSGWTTPQVDLGGRSLAELVGATVDFEAELTVDVDGSSPVDPSISAVLDRYLGGLPYVTVGYTTGAGERRTLHLVYEAAPVGGPALVGIVSP